MLFDILTGFVKAMIWKVWNSDTGLKGLSKHLLIFIGVTLSYIFLYHINVNDEVEYIVHMFTLYYIYCYANSILENFGVMGIPYPKYLRNKVQNEIDKMVDNGGRK